jgi:hypothetical protein
MSKIHRIQTPISLDDLEHVEEEGGITVFPSILPSTGTPTQVSGTSHFIFNDTIDELAFHDSFNDFKKYNSCLLTNNCCFFFFKIIERVVEGKLAVYSTPKLAVVFDRPLRRKAKKK